MDDSRIGLKMVQVRLVPDRTLMSNVCINSPEVCVDVMKDFYNDLDREVIMIVNVDNKCHPINCNLASIGTLTSCIAQPREIFKSAILSNAGAIIMFHNHPGGSPTPSPEDIEITRRIAAAGEILGIHLMDHIVIAGKYHCSIRTGYPDIFNARLEKGTYGKITDLLISNRRKGR